MTTELQSTSSSAVVPASQYVIQIYYLRGQAVVLDTDVANAFDVLTKRIGEAMRRNPTKFEEEYSFILTSDELDVLRSQFATANNGRGGRRTLPRAFTERGVAMLATILRTERAIQAAKLIIDTFVEARNERRLKSNLFTDPVESRNADQFITLVDRMSATDGSQRVIEFQPGAAAPDDVFSVPAKTISIAIDGRWEPEDFAKTFQAIESLYYQALWREGLFPELPGPPQALLADANDEQEIVRISRMWTRELTAIAPPISRLTVRSISYASPGKMDLAGIGEAANVVDRIIERLIGLFTDRRQRRAKDDQANLDTKLKEQELAKAKLENAKTILALGKEHPESLPWLASLMLNQEPIVELIDRRLIRSNTQ